MIKWGEVPYGDETYVWGSHRYWLRSTKKSKASAAKLAVELRRKGYSAIVRKVVDFDWYAVYTFPRGPALEDIFGKRGYQEHEERHSLREILDLKKKAKERRVKRGKIRRKVIKRKLVGLLHKRLRSKS